MKTTERKLPTNLHSRLSLPLASLGLLSAFALAEARNDIADIAAPVTVLDASQLDSFGMATIQDMGAIVPQLNTGVSNNLRGIASSNVGDFFLSSPVTLSGAGMDISRIEVLRGPQGTLFGSDRIVGALDVGYTGNTRGNPTSDHSSGFISASADYRDTIKLGGGDLTLGVGATLTRYDNALDNRPGDDQLLQDYRFSAEYVNLLSDSSRLDVTANVSYGEHGTAARGFLWSGALDNAVTNFRFGGMFTTKLGETTLDDPGLASRTSFYFAGFNESGSSNPDSHRFGVVQEWIQSNTKTEGYYARLGIGMREFSEMSDYDSLKFTGALGLKTQLPCGAGCTIGAGFEHREYDGSGIDSRTVPTFEASLFGLSGDTRYSCGVQYGIFDKFASAGGDSVDPEGLQFGARLTHRLSDKYNIGFALESFYLNAESSDTANGNFNMQQGTVFMEYKPQDGISLEASASLIRVNRGTSTSSSNDSFGLFRAGARLRY